MHAAQLTARAQDVSQEEFMTTRALALGTGARASAGLERDRSDHT